MVGTSWDMLLGMTGTGRLTGSEELAGRCVFILISFLFFLAGEVEDNKGRRLIDGNAKAFHGRPEMIGSSAQLKDE